MDHPGHGVRCPAHLLLDQDLLEVGEPAAPEVLRHVDGPEPDLLRAAFGFLLHTVRQLALMRLRIFLMGDELVDEGAGPVLDVPVLVAHGVGHGLPPREAVEKFD